MQENCEKKGVNVTQLAAIIKEQQPTLYRIYRGLSKNPHLRIIEKLENYFGVKYMPDGSVVYKATGSYTGAFSVQEKQTDYAVKPAIEVAGMKINSMEEHLLSLYRKLSGSSQRHVDLLVNHIYSLEHPDDLIANPTNGKKKKEATKQ